MSEETSDGEAGELGEVFEAGELGVDAPGRRPRSPLPQAPGLTEWPLLTGELEGIGGRLSPLPADFLVDEVPAYAASGEGTHHYVRIEKQGLTTADVRLALVTAAGVDPRDVGFAGRKDKHARTTQWFSLPAPAVDPGINGLRLLEVTRHANKLKLGHLRGNRFQITLVDVSEEAERRLPPLLARLADGFPNAYGEQRFGAAGRSYDQALRFVAAPRRRVSDPGFLASVIQAAGFNTWLAARLRDGLFGKGIAGDVLKKRDTGGLFVSPDAETDGPRVERAEVDPTGPMFGRRMFAAEGPSLLREEVAKASMPLTVAEWAVVDQWAAGTRRVARVVAEELSISRTETGLVLSFFLPSGCFATVFLAELMHPPGRLRLPIEG